MMRTEGSLKQQLGSQLRAATERYPQRQHRRRVAWLGLTTSLVIALAVGTLVVLRPEARDPAVAKFPRLVSDQSLKISQVSGDTFTVSLNEAAADPAAMENELAQAGIDAAITLLPVSDSLVGRLRALTSPDDPSATNPDRLAETIDLRRGHSYTLWIGRAAGPDEPYAIGRGPFFPGEPMYCSGLHLLTNPLDVESELRNRGYSVSWRYLDVPVTVEDGREVGTGVSEVRDTPPEGVVGQWIGLSPSQFVIFVSPDEQVPDDRSQLFPPQDC